MHLADGVASNGIRRRGPDETISRRVVLLTIALTIVVIGLTAGVGMSPELAAARAAIAKAERLPRPPVQVLHAVIAAEHPWFWSGGISGPARELLQPARKNVWLSPARCSLFCRARRIAAISLLLRLHDRETLLRAYIATVYMGDVDGRSVSGLQEAAQAYFGADLNALPLGQWATLAGMIRAPELLSPTTHPDRALARRNFVLDQMRNEKTISDAEHRDATVSPVRIAG